MAATRRAYTGGAQSTTTTSAIASSGTTSFTITAYTGWPYGSDPFFVVVEPGTASEEKILVTRTGSTDTTINIASDSERAQDGTSAVAHSSGSTVFPVFTALDADEANELTSSWSTKGDLVSYGSSTFETLGVGSDGQVLVADSGETSGLKWSTSLSGLAVDTDTLYVDTSNNRVGVNDATPSYTLDVTGDINATGDLRIGGTAVGNWTAFTPSWFNVTVGNATQTAHYAVVNEVVHVVGEFVFGSTSAFTGSIGLSAPVTANTTVMRDFTGVGQVIVNGNRFGMVQHYSGDFYFYSLNTGAATGAANMPNMNATSPITFTTGDDIRYHFTYATT